MTRTLTTIQHFSTKCYHCGEIIYVKAEFSQELEEKCAHEWHADQDNDCNFCVKCGARQEIYTEQEIDMAELGMERAAAEEGWRDR